MDGIIALLIIVALILGVYKIELARHRCDEAVIEKVVQKLILSIMAKSKKETIKPKKKGQKKITFTKGGLHKSSGVKSGKKMTAKEHAQAKSGKLGKKAQKQELFYENVLKGKGGKSKRNARGVRKHG